MCIKTNINAIIMMILLLNAFYINMSITAHTKSIVRANKKERLVVSCVFIFMPLVFQDHKNANNL